MEVDLGFMNFSEKLLSFAFVMNKSPKIAHKIEKILVIDWISAA